MKVTFENNRLTFEPTKPGDEEALQRWWAQAEAAQAIGDANESSLYAYSFEKALLIGI
jgi:hypothetical protein